MHRLSFILPVLLAVGCSQAEAVPVEGILPVVVAESLIQQPPAPAVPSGTCPECRGTGKLGDGRVSVTCTVCNGTGRLSGEYPISLELPAQCSGSSCSTGPVRTFVASRKFRPVRAALHRIFRR